MLARAVRFTPSNSADAADRWPMFCVGRFPGDGAACDGRHALEEFTEVPRRLDARMSATGALTSGALGARTSAPGARTSAPDDAMTAPLYAGEVLSDFLKRTLSRAITQSRVAVVGGDAANETVAARARAEGHAVVFVDAGTRAEDPTDADRSRPAPRGALDKAAAAPPKSWYLLFFVDATGRSAEALAGAARRFYDSTITYVVLVVDPRRERDFAGGRVGLGVGAVRFLLQRHYKVQLLASTKSLPGLDPNALLTDANAKPILARAERRGAVLLLFATQGFDLAVASAADYLSEGRTATTGRKCCRQFMPSCLPEHRACTKSNLAVAWTEDGAGVGVRCRNREIAAGGVQRVWYSAGDESEAACVHVKGSACPTRPNQRPVRGCAPYDRDVDVRNDQAAQQVACARPRLIPDWPVAPWPAARPDDRPPNLVVIMLDPLSDARFRMAFPATRAALGELGFASFGRYGVVGPNSGVNQAALYAGAVLEGRAVEHVDGWLWDHLGAAGYATLKTEDACVANSDMLQSTRPNTTHGRQLERLFCFHFQRPNCVAGRLASEVSLTYAADFVKKYDGVAPWAALVHLVDSHEDSFGLAGVVDKPVAAFLRQTLAGRDDVLAVVLSDHGLHYGDYFLTPAGRRERNRPTLHVRAPPAVHAAVAQNAEARVGPFDVHATFLDVLLGATTARGTSLAQPLQRDRSLAALGIPDATFDPEAPSPPSGECSILDAPASLVGYQADAARGTPAELATCPTRRRSSLDGAELAVDGDCTCATNARASWAECPGDVQDDDFFVAVHCEETEGIDVHFRAPPALDGPANASVPSVLVFEIDSASSRYFERFFPATMALLREAETGRHATHEAVRFRKAMISGENSIPNQLALLSGCVGVTPSAAAKFADAFDLEPRGLSGEHKMLGRRDPVQRLCRKGSRAPFLQDVARSRGAAMILSDEFCVDGSPWVVNQFFDAAPDVQLDEFYCLEKALRKSHEKNETKLECAFEGGEYAQTLGLRALTEFWRLERPKFAYYSSSVAHRYPRPIPAIYRAARAFDAPLAAFLRGLLMRPDTYVLLRSDHGLQQANGWSADWSYQIEHRLPFAALFAPRRGALRDDALATLRANSDRLVTSFDLYKTLRGLLDPASRGDDSAAPPWAIDLLTQRVPRNRSCGDALVPRDFCACSDDASASYAPNFNLCHTINEAARGSILGHSVCPGNGLVGGMS
mmetsp:Transcript_36458/g.112782  ORF Transcript_36458/g.112782 Transcript_36458/m.112782 type:complete len:1213 (-) Transcript_36458:23-3661(-)